MLYAGNEARGLQLAGAGGAQQRASRAVRRGGLTEQAGQHLRALHSVGCTQRRRGQENAAAGVGRRMQRTQRPAAGAPVADHSKVRVVLGPLPGRQALHPYLQAGRAGASLLRSSQDTVCLHGMQHWHQSGSG